MFFSGLNLYIKTCTQAFKSLVEKTSSVLRLSAMQCDAKAVSTIAHAAAGLGIRDVSVGRRCGLQPPQNVCRILTDKASLIWPGPWPRCQRSKVDSNLPKNLPQGRTDSCQTSPRKSCAMCCGPLGSWEFGTTN